MIARKSGQTLIVGITIVSATIGCAVAEEPDSTVRPPQFAGSWYPSDPAELTKLINDHLAKAEPPDITGKPIAIVSPHAGYVYTGPVVAAGYACLKSHTYQRVIVMAFSHQYSGTYTGVDVPDKLTAYETPLGRVPIGREICDALLKKPGFSAHAGVGRREWSLEMQLPFLQAVLKDFRLVPLLVGRMSDRDCLQAAEAIVPFLDEDTLLVASSDFTHYGRYYHYVPFEDDVPNKLRELADKATAPILRCDYDGFVDHLNETRDTICGRGPITLLLRTLSMEGGASGVRTGIDMFGRITGDWRRSVTYQSIVLTRRPGTLGAQERDTLLRLARQTVTAQLNGTALPKVDPGQLPDALRADGACFVTLENDGVLRGCIGHLVAREPLYQSVIHNAVSACKDYRFVRNPVTAKELEELHIEISYLTPMKLVEDPDKIVVGRHGLLISMKGKRGVLLPQVAARYGWSREGFLSQTCRKAGLPLDAWKRPAAELYSFEAEVFGEPEATGASPSQ